mmetsp:Transcript_22134/g.33148  ORF Transcript_22134/g.33148 Transcript_22134/m.33148 type:complete len:411 (-) Transcript_22134:310-1542(-)
MAAEESCAVPEGSKGEQCLQLVPVDATQEPDLKEAPSPKDEIDREEFSGFRIADRTVSVSDWAEEMSTGKRQFVPLNRLSVTPPVRGIDRIVIGILYDISPNEELLTGERYAILRLTDLATPRPTLVELQLRRHAFVEWRSGAFAAEAKFGAIFAVENPMLDSRLGMPGPVSLRIEAKQCLVKLGTCPSLKRCQVKKCCSPCNGDRKEIYCRDHMLKAFSQRSVRQVTGGMTREVHRLMEKEKAAEAVKRRDRVTLQEKVEVAMEKAEAKAERTKEANLQRTRNSVKLDERRFWSRDSNLDYARSVFDTDPTATLSLSLQPALARGVSADDEDAVIDFGDVDTKEEESRARLRRVCEEKRKVSQKRGADSMVSSDAKRKRGSEALLPTTLEALVEAYDRKPLPRRATSCR